MITAEKKHQLPQNIKETIKEKIEMLLFNIEDAINKNIKIKIDNSVITTGNTIDCNIQNNRK